MENNQLKQADYFHLTSGAHEWWWPFNYRQQHITGSSDVILNVFSKIVTVDTVYHIL